MKKITEKHYLYGVIILFLTLCGFSFIRYPDLRNEMKYFVVLSEMIQNKQYIILTYLGNLYPDKPPVYFWILGIIKTIFDKNAYPIALIFSGVIPLFTGALFLKKIFKTYFVSLIFLTMLFVSGASLVLRMDTLMSMFITIAIVNFYLAYKSYKENPECENLKYFYGIFISIALAIMIKGVGGIIVPISTMIFFAYLNGDFKFFKKIKIWRGVGLILAIISLWFIAIYFSKNGKEYLTLMLGKQTVGRVVNSYTHKRPVFYYLKNIFLTTMPFGIIFLTGICLYFKDFKNRKNWDLLEKLSISWIIPSFIIFSLVSGKLDIYLLPIYPGIAGLIYCFYKRDEWRKYFEMSLKITVGLLALVGTAIVVISNLPKYDVSFGAKVLSAILFLVTIWMAYRMKKSQDKTELFPMISAVAILIFIVAFGEGENFNRNNTIKPLQSHIVDIRNSKNKEITLFRFPDGINLLETLKVPYENYKEVSDLKTAVEERDEIVVLVRKKDVKKLNELKKEYDYKDIFHNENYYLVEISILK